MSPSESDASKRFLETLKKLADEEKEDVTSTLKKRPDEGLAGNSIDDLRIAQIAHQDAKTKDLEKDTNLKEEYANKAFWFLSVWCSVTLFIVMFQGFKVQGFQISDTVLSILVGTTTVSAIALLGYILKGLFLSKK